jgi:uncharacterized protein YjlB
MTLADILAEKRDISTTIQNRRSRNLQCLRNRKKIPPEKEKKIHMRSLVDATGAVQHINIIRHLIADDGRFPNHGLLPLLVYRKALILPESDSDKIVTDIFESNGWTNSWTNGVYDYHHYHSTAHEVLGIIKGSARIQFGGPSGISLLLEAGDVVIIPAGVAHKKIGDDDHFSCVGAYPDGQQYDMNYGKEGERPAADQRIKNLPLPEADPVYGTNGPLKKNWESEERIPEEEEIE